MVCCDWYVDMKMEVKQQELFLNDMEIICNYMYHIKTAIK